METGKLTLDYLIINIDIVRSSDRQIGIQTILDSSSLQRKARTWTSLYFSRGLMLRRKQISQKVYEILQTKCELKMYLLEQSCIFILTLYAS